MNKILEELEKFNESFVLESYQSNRMQEFDSKEVEELNKFQRYELELNQDFLQFNHYEDLKETIFINNLGDLNYFDIDRSELIDYIEMKLIQKLSIDRKYFFNEMRLYFCDQVNKRDYAHDTLESLKTCINEKLKSEFDYSFILQLSARLVILVQTYKINEYSFIEEIICNKILNESDYKSNFFLLIRFYKFLFDEYKKKIDDVIMNQFNSFSDDIKRTLLTTLYDPSRHYAARIAEVYEIVNDYNKKVYFYQREVDNALEKIRDFCEAGEAFRFQSTIKYILIISHKKITYKTKEVKALAKKIANCIKNNTNKIFPKIQVDENNEMQKIANDAYEIIKSNFKKTTDDGEKIDYLLFCELYTNFSTQSYEESLKNQKEHGFFKLFFPNSTRINHHGYSYDIKKDYKLFNFLNHSVSFFNYLFLRLDFDYNWVKISNKILIDNTDNIQIISGYEKQYKTALKLFEEEKYIEFMYISPGLIENILRTYLYEINGEALSFRSDNPIEKTLNQILEELIKDDNCYIDKYFLEYIDFVLVDNTGINLRNDIVHGTFHDGFFNNSNSMYLYVILVFLMRYFYYDQD
jgi:hypothetical protein